MTPLRKWLFLENADALWAEEVIKDRGGSLGARSLYVLKLLATGDKDAAVDAWARRNAEVMRDGGVAEELPY